MGDLRISPIHKNVKLLIITIDNHNKNILGNVHTKDSDGLNNNDDPILHNHNPAISRLIIIPHLKMFVNNIILIELFSLNTFFEKIA